MKRQSSAGGKAKEVRRVKTFTGCWTCRSRKVKCDLGKPTCQRCDKSGLECGGYDIKLRWSQPIRFDSFGQVDPNTSSSACADEPQSQRRNVGFVTYKDEYEFYEDMDDELSELHSPSLDKIADNKTWIIKKFGVFRGTDKVKTKHVPRRKKRRKQDQQSRSPKIRSEVSGVTSSNMGDDTELHSAQNIANLFDFDLSMNFNGNEWIANELRDDALLSASAIQGIPMDSLFDRPKNFSTSLPATSESSNTSAPRSEGPSVQESQDKQRHNSQQTGSVNGADFSQIYKLLFHRGPDLLRTHRSNSVPTDHQSTPRTIVPLQNIILVDSSGPEGHMPKEVLEVVESEVPEPRIFNVPNNSNPLLTLPTTGLKVHGLTRFLLNYYLQNVVDLMTVVALPTNPWRTIYFPRASRALGDLAGVGYTSNSRNSLLNAILAVSCFNLQSKFPRNSPEMRYYVQLGIELRGQASDFLKICLESTAKQERYKDILTAILSMNSIDVVWGTMADCQYHLMLCENLVEERMKTRPKISGKARSLHRIFSFLKLIQDSTALDKVQEKEIVLGKSQSENLEEELNRGDQEEMGEFKESLDEVNGKIRIEFVKHGGGSGSTPIFTNIASQTYYYPSSTAANNDFLSTDALYGLPNSIILLFSDCVRLARHREYYRMRKLDIPSSYYVLCTTFEKKLMGWKSEWNFFKPDTRDFLNDTVEGVYHHTISFYEGLIIYHHTMVRGQGHKGVQNNVGKVLDHLDKLAALIHDKGVKIVPLIWQGFIAGCAAIDTGLQLKFKEWAAKLANSGMGSYWGARQIMFEVWRRRMNGEHCDNWFDVYRDWEMNLMLS